MSIFSDDIVQCTSVNRIDPDSMTDSANMIDPDSIIDSANIIDPDSMTDSDNMIDPDSMTNSANMIDTDSMTDSANMIDTYMTDSAKLESSYMSMYGLPTDYMGSSSFGSEDVFKQPLQSCTSSLSTIPCIIDELGSIFQCCPMQLQCPMEMDTKGKLLNLMHRMRLTDGEMSKYIHRDDSLPYTRNLIYSDRINYSLLLLCWGPDRESKIHDHPSRGCFLKVLRGSIRETIYGVYPERNEICERSACVHSAGSVSFMSDDIGLHKISNPSADQPAISLHLYVPPFQKCKVQLYVPLINMHRCTSRYSL